MISLLFGPSNGSAGTALSSLATLAGAVVRRLKNRRDVTRLAEWDDHALRDIGLTRADVHLALALPIREDPSLRLQFWAHERRSARLRRRDRADIGAGRLQGRSGALSAGRSKIESIAFR